MKPEFAICDLRCATEGPPDPARPSPRPPGHVSRPSPPSSLYSSSLATSNQQLATPTSRPAFTLIEMLVVISIMVLAMTFAIPAIRSLTGSRSGEAAENALTALVGLARTEAISQQRVEGLMFYLDTTTDRVNCVLVYQTPRQSGPGNNPLLGDVAGVAYLDVVPDRDPHALPAGIRLWTMKDQPSNLTGNNLIDAVRPYRYLGFNTLVGNQPISDPGLSSAPTYQGIPGGVILFNSAGRLVAVPYGFRFLNLVGGGLTGLGQLCFGGNQTPTGVADWPPPQSTSALYSQTAVVMFDRETFLNATGASGNPFTDWNNPAAEGDIDQWIDINTTPIFINRYNGSLMCAE